jgi:hypothetical protein
MTALQKYDRIEAAGLWRAHPEARAIDVILSLGDATLTINDMRDRALAHWSLGALVRQNPNAMPAIFHPEGDETETLELAEDETQMIDALMQIISAVEKRRPRRGRLRLWSILGITALVGISGVMFVPDILRHHALRVVPLAKRAEIGQSILTHLSSSLGPKCRATRQAETALINLQHRLFESGPTLHVVPSGINETLSLPGKIILIGHPLVEDFDEPDPLAGFILAANLTLKASDPLDNLLKSIGMRGTLRLLTTGQINAPQLASYAKSLLRQNQERPSAEVLAPVFQDAGVRMAPYAYAIDITGETTLDLIEAGQFQTDGTRPILSDADWIRLQGICGG